MGDAIHRHWRRWRLTTAKPTLVSRAKLGDRLRSPSPPAATPATGPDEEPAADGIRHGLVARIRAEIAAGSYDTEEKWLAAEAKLLLRVEERM